MPLTVKRGQHGGSGGGGAGGAGGSLGGAAKLSGLPSDSTVSERLSAWVGVNSSRRGSVIACVATCAGAMAAGSAMVSSVADGVSLVCSTRPSTLVTDAASPASWLPARYPRRSAIPATAKISNRMASGRIAAETRAAVVPSCGRGGRCAGAGGGGAAGGGADGGGTAGGGAADGGADGGGAAGGGADGGGTAGGGAGVGRDACGGCGAVTPGRPAGVSGRPAVAPCRRSASSSRLIRDAPPTGLRRAARSRP